MWIWVRLTLKFYFIEPWQSYNWLQQNLDLFQTYSVYILFTKSSKKICIVLEILRDHIFWLIAVSWPQSSLTDQSVVISVEGS